MPARRDDISRADLVLLFGIADNTVSDWIKQGCPHRMVGRRPRFVVAQVWRWHDSRARAARQAPPTDITNARKRKLSAEAELAEIDVAKARGDLVTLDFAEAELRRIHEAAAAWIKALPGALASRLGTCSTTIERLAMLKREANDGLRLLRAHGAAIDAIPETARPRTRKAATR